VDERILAQRAQHSPTDQEHESNEERNCFYCLSGWVFLGSIGHDGEEVYEAIRCRRCGGTGQLVVEYLRQPGWGPPGLQPFSYAPQRIFIQHHKV
jgi:hypothetical protein